jgi:hypothetical protein
LDEPVFFARFEQWFREAVSRDDAMPDYITELFFAAFVPLYEHHQQMLVEIEQRLSSW